MNNRSDILKDFIVLNYINSTNDIIKDIQSTKDKMKDIVKDIELLKNMTSTNDIVKNIKSMKHPMEKKMKDIEKIEELNLANDILKDTMKDMKLTTKNVMRILNQQQTLNK